MAVDRGGRAAIEIPEQRRGFILAELGELDPGRQRRRRARRSGAPGRWRSGTRARATQARPATFAGAPRSARSSRHRPSARHRARSPRASRRPVARRARDRAVGAIALVADHRRGAAPSRSDGKIAASSPRASSRGVETVVEAGAEIGVDRLDHDAERPVALELRRLAVQDDVAPVLGERPKLGQQPRLADARLAGRSRRSRATASSVSSDASSASSSAVRSDERLPQRRHRLWRA